MASEAQSDAIRVDSHHHFWDMSRFGYEWMPPEPNVLRRNYLPEDLAPLIERNGISQSVVVQAYQSIDEADFLLGLADASDVVAGIVAWVDLTSPDVGDVLDRLAKHPKIVGIRHQVHDEHDEAWTVREDVIEGLREVAGHGLRYDLLFRPQHLKYVHPLAEKVPDLKMVIDHIAKPNIAAAEFEPWARDIASAAEVPGIYCKVSGMITEADHSTWTAEDLKPYVAQVAEHFGIDRLMFGSDWPVCLLAGSYDQVVQAALDAIGPIGDEYIATFLGGNAIEFYGLGE